MESNPVQKMVENQEPRESLLLRRRREFLAELRSQIEFPPNDEEVTRQFHDAALYCNVRIEAYRSLTNAYLASEPVPVPSYWLNKFFKAHQIELLRPEMRDKWGYPEAFNDGSKWREFITAHLSNPDHPVFINVINSLQQRLQINRWKRKQALAFIIGGEYLANPNREPVIVHEYGSAENLVLKALAVGVKTRTLMHSKDNVQDVAQTAAFNATADLALLGRGYGIEVDPPTTEEDHHRVKGYTLDPSQLDRNVLSDSEEDTYDLLVESLPPSVKRITGNFLDLSQDNRERLEKDKADYAFLSHVLPQNPGKLEEVMETVRGLLKPGGLAVINEYASPDIADPRRLVYPSSWYSARWRCNSLGWLPNRSEDGFFTIFNWKTAHCEHGRASQDGLARLALDHLLKFG